MDLDNRLKELNELPVGRIKHKINVKIRNKKAYRSPLWKEIVLLSSIAFIALTLMILPSMDSPQQATSQSVEAIYAYENSEEGKFFARPSTLFLGVKEITEPAMLDFFEHYSDFVQPSNMPINDSIIPFDLSYIDIVVIRNGKEEYWKITWEGILNVATNQFYKANDEDSFGDMIMKTFYSDQGGSIPPLFIIPLLGILVSIIPPIIYNVRKRDEKSPLNYNLKYGIIPFLTYMAVIGWHNLIGPLYKPFLGILVILFSLYTHFFLRSLKPSTFVYRIEIIRYSVLMILLLILIFSF